MLCFLAITGSVRTCYVIIADVVASGGLLNQHGFPRTTPQFARSSARYNRTEWHPVEKLLDTGIDRPYGGRIAAI